MVLQLRQNLELPWNISVKLELDLECFCPKTRQKRRLGLEQFCPSERESKVKEVRRGVRSPVR